MMNYNVLFCLKLLTHNQRIKINHFFTYANHELPGTME